MANSLLDLGLDQQKAWFNRALAQQKALYDATLKMGGRLFTVPRDIDRARNVRGIALGTVKPALVRALDCWPKAWDRVSKARRASPSVMLAKAGTMSSTDMIVPATTGSSIPMSGS